MGSPYLRQDITDQMLTAEIGAYLKSAKRALARPPAQVERPDFEKRRADVTRKRDNVLRLVAEGHATIADAAKTLREIDDERAVIDATEAEFKACLTEDTVEHRRGALVFVEQVAEEWGTLAIDVRRTVLGILAREITVGKERQPRIVWKEPGELAVDYAIGALPSLRAPVVKTLPVPRTRRSDRLEAAQESTESLALKAS
jgi:hypothetical protein